MSEAIKLRLDFYGEGDSRAYDEDEVLLMEAYVAKIPRQKLRIETKYWTHECADGCCFRTGTEIFVNEVSVSQGEDDDLQTVLKEVLEHLGYEVED